MCRLRGTDGVIGVCVCVCVCVRVRVYMRVRVYVSGDGDGGKRGGGRRRWVTPGPAAERPSRCRRPDEAYRQGVLTCKLPR